MDRENFKITNSYVKYMSKWKDVYDLKQIWLKLIRTDKVCCSKVSHVENEEGVKRAVRDEDTTFKTQFFSHIQGLNVKERQEAARK